jgi:hypothetical protein
LRFCESSISASLEVWRKYLYTIFLAAGLNQSSALPRRWRRRALTPQNRQLKKTAWGQAVSRVPLQRFNSLTVQRFNFLTIQLPRASASIFFACSICATVTSDNSQNWIERRLATCAR